MSSVVLVLAFVVACLAVLYARREHLPFESRLGAGVAVVVTFAALGWRMYGDLSGSHLLSMLLAIPMLGALVILFMPRQWVDGIRAASIVFMLVELLASTWLLDADYTQPGYLFVEDAEWIAAFGIRYQLGIDGISLWLVLLTTLLTPISLYVSWSSVSTKIKEYAVAFLLLEVGMVGAFVATDLFLFYVFWELMLVPMYLIIGIWGGKDRIYAAVKFFLYTMAGSLLMLVAILYVASAYHQQSGGEWSFALADLLRLSFPLEEQLLLLCAFSLAFAIKVPMFPFHTWLPDAHVQAPTGGSVILAAVLLKLGGYGFLRFALPLFPQAWHFGLESRSFGSFIAVLAVIGIVYGALCAWVQRDVKKLVAYSSVSHLGFVMLGIASANVSGMSGAVLQMVAHGVSTGALFILVGVIYDRRHTRDLADFGGLAKVMPWYAVIFVIVTMSSVGLPGTNGFIGEFMILAGTFASDDLGAWQTMFVLVAATGVILAAVYMLHAVLKMFWGPLDKKENQALSDLNHREVIALVPLVIAVFWMGLFPRTLLDSIEPAVERVLVEYRADWNRGFSSDVSLEPRPEPAPVEAEGAVVGAEGAVVGAEGEGAAAPAPGDAAPGGAAPAAVPGGDAAAAGGGAR